MTADELLIVNKLFFCKASPGSWAKRYIDDLYSISKANPDYLLTEPQKEWVYRLLYEYRKRVPFTYKKFKSHPHCKKLKPVATN